MNKKGITAFNTISVGLVSFLIFVLVAILAILLISTIKGTTLACPVIYDNGVCVSCPTHANTGSNWTYNTSSNVCCNANFTATTNCGTANTTSALSYSGSSWNGTLQLEEATALPPQFAQIIVIVMIIIAILGMLGAVGYLGYQKLNK